MMNFDAVNCMSWVYDVSHTFRMTTLRYKPVSLRPSGLAESRLLLIGLEPRLFGVDDGLLEREDDLRRCGIIRTMFRAQDEVVESAEFPGVENMAMPMSQGW